ncbi:MAG: hypothetical protein MZV63_43285 [Marinilabiliales bacterium]|nr:hypothetical protein [Marinilabiliales bacterium]
MRKSWRGGGIISCWFRCRGPDCLEQSDALAARYDIAVRFIETDLMRAEAPGEIMEVCG